MEVCETKQHVCLFCFSFFNDIRPEVLLIYLESGYVCVCSFNLPSHPPFQTPKISQEKNHISITSHFKHQRFLRKKKKKKRQKKNNKKKKNNKQKEKEKETKTTHLSRDVKSSANLSDLSTSAASASFHSPEPERAGGWAGCGWRSRSNRSSWGFRA